MSEIFVSYASSDRERARLIAKHLEQRGWTVWWDRSIPPGRTFDEVIEEAIDSAQCMLVLWSNASVASQWVKTEAAEGARRGVLVPALIDNVKIPLEFRRIQAANLVGWEGSLPHPEFDLLADAIARVLGRSPSAPADQMPTPPQSLPAAPPMPALAAGQHVSAAVARQPGQPAGPAPVRASVQLGPQMAPQPRVPLRLRQSVMILVGGLADSLMLTVRSGSPEKRAARWHAALAAAAGAGGAALVYGGIWGVWRGNWGWALLPAILAALLTYIWVYGAQQHPPRAAKAGAIAGLVVAPILTASLTALLNPTVQMARWVAVESLAWAVYGLFGGIVIERGLRLRTPAPPVVVALVAATAAVLILIGVIYREFSGFRLMVGLGWAIAMMMAPIVQAHASGPDPGADGLASDKTLPS